MAVNNKDLSRLVARLNAPEVVECGSCRQSFDDCSDLFVHIEADHGIALPSSDNLLDVAAFLALVPRLCNRELTASSDVIAACFVAGTRVDAAASASADAQSSVGDDAANGNDDEDDWEDDDCPIPAQCLFCSVVTPTVEAHMLAEHGFNLRASALFQRSVCPDEYARVRLVNFTRARVLKGECPLESCAVATGSDAAALALHIAEHKHYLNTTAPEGDEWVVAVLRGDAFMMLVMGAEEDAVPEPEYPLVPTMMELARRHREAHGETDE